MKPDEQSRDDEAFEREMARFRREEPPASWREELIENALPTAGIHQIRTGSKGGFWKRIHFSFPEKILGGGLAAAWVAIAGFTLTVSPDPHPPEKAPISRASNSPSKLPILAWRLRGGEFGEQTLP